MPFLMPSGREILATAVVDSLVVAADPYAREASITFWDRARPWNEAVVDAVRRSEDSRIRSLGRALVDEPTAPARYAALRAALMERDRTRVDALFDLAWQAECHSRLGFHLGSKYRAGEDPVTIDEMRSWSPGSRATDLRNAEILVVVPFRDRDTGGMRLRNLLACLLALLDQSVPRERYQVTVVECDDKPRWREVIAPYADTYLFAEKTGAFNKSWAVNVGVVNSPGQAEVICILDADVLADRDFVVRNAARFRRPGTSGHLTYRNMLCADAPATSWAIRERLSRRTAEVDQKDLRCFVVRRPVGCCLWVRSAAFHRVGGMDERFEGWGGEDNDFAYRFDVLNALDGFDDLLLHMYHPASSSPDGELTNATVPPLSWRPGQAIGRLDRFASNRGV